MNTEPLFEVTSQYPGKFPAPTLKGNETWLLARLAEVWSHYRDDPVTPLLKTEVLNVMARNRYFNSAIVDFEIVNGLPVNVTFHHGLARVEPLM